MSIKEIIYILIAYLVGSISWSYIISKVLWKEDIRTKGSGNAGASNMTINHGWKFGILVFLLDFLKAFVMVFLVKNLPLFENLNENELLRLKFLAGYAAILGHNFPIWHSFRGGKGTASGVGMAFGLGPVIGLIAGLSVVIIGFTTKYIALGGVAFWYITAVASYFIYKNIWIAISFVFMGLLSTYLHRKNLRRIFSGEEVAIKKEFDDKDKDLMK